MYMIAGLGNPGRKYENTRHNAGWMCVDRMAERAGITWKDGKFNAWEGKGVIGGVPVLLVKPLTFMNLSGDAIAPLVNYYRLNPETDLLVISDEIALPAGELRLRRKGSAGGHNGLKNIIARLGTSDFARLRLGVGPLPEEIPMVDFVLGRLAGEDKVRFDDALSKAEEAALMTATGRIEEAMNLFNRKVIEG